MTNNPRKRRGRPATSNCVWIEPEMNEELDARKLSRAFLALALHQAAEETQARADHLQSHAEESDDARG